MIRVGILGDIGSGKSYVAKQFGFPVFNADVEVAKLYKKDEKIFNKLKKIFPKYFNKFPTKKEEVLKAILANKKNLKKIVKIVHSEIRKKMEIFLKKNNNKKIIILDIPLLLENNINKKRDILVYVHSQKSDILKRLKKRPNYNNRVLKRFRNVQLPLDYKKKKSQFIIKNNFTNRYVKVQIKSILKKIL
mgnify:CR=1 FL=1